MPPFLAVLGAVDLARVWPCKTDGSCETKGLEPGAGGGESGDRGAVVAWLHHGPGGVVCGP